MRIKDRRADISLERLKADLALRNENQLLTERSVIEYAQIAIRWTIIGNGAIATALLTAMDDKDCPRPSLSIAVIVAALGVACGLSAAIFAYLSQWQYLKRFYQSQDPGTPGTRWERGAGLLCIVAGIAAFVISVVSAAISFNY